MCHIRPFFFLSLLYVNSRTSNPGSHSRLASPLPSINSLCVQYDREKTPALSDVVLVLYFLSFLFLFLSLVSVMLLFLLLFRVRVLVLTINIGLVRVFVLVEDACRSRAGGLEAGEGEPGAHEAAASGGAPAPHRPAEERLRNTGDPDSPALFDKIRRIFAPLIRNRR